MLDIMSAFSSITIIYFIFLSFSGAYFFLNITLAVISVEYEHQKGAIDEIPDDLSFEIQKLFKVKKFQSKVPVPTADSEE